MKKRRFMIYLCAPLVVACIVLWLRPSIVASVIQRVKGRKTIEQRIEEFGEAALKRIKPNFDRVGVAYPPAKIVLLAIKEDRRLYLFAGNNESVSLVTSWKILGMSGERGPKLCEGDNQVPEGIYQIDSLNPNSLFHVSLRLNYPNAFDREMAEADKRNNLGGDIMIHGSSASIGCLAMGDEAAEEIFTLAHDSGLGNMKVIIVPIDFRKKSDWKPESNQPSWLDHLYSNLQQELDRLPFAAEAARP